MDAVSEVFGIFARHGRDAYLGEAVSQIEHALQAGRLAELEGAGDALVIAALLHDIGHICAGVETHEVRPSRDHGHEIRGAAWLAERFPPEVSEPVRLHVDAKRYLCATDPAYLRRLSPASLHSLELQGGPLDEDGCADFRRKPHWEAAVSLRRWDEGAKVVGRERPGLEHYRSRLEVLAVR